MVWTAEFAAKGYVEVVAAGSCPDRGPPGTCGLDAATYFNKLYAMSKHHRRWNPLATARTCSTSTSFSHRPLFDEMKAACDKITRRRERLQARMLRRSVQQVRGPDG